MTNDPNGDDVLRSGLLAELDSSRKLSHRLAFYDRLTGLPNRRCFEDVLARLRHADSPLALLLLDIDELGSVNDTSGHEAADDLIRGVAGCLQTEIGDHDVFRIAGDEFAIIDTACRSSAILGILAERMLAATRTAIADGNLPSFTISIGGALSNDGDSDFASVRQNARLALRNAKETNKGGYVEFDEVMREAATSRVEVLGSVSTALADGRMSTYYQPLVMLDGREVIGLEALSRMSDTSGAIVSAGSFQAAFADPVIAMRLTDGMLRQVASDIRRWLDDGVPFQHVGINLSAVDFERRDLEERITAAFDQAGVPLKHVVLEVTEAVFMDGMTSGIVEAVERLKQQGMLVALDDFGTGFASLTHLLNFPVDIIKIDKSFIDGVVTDLASEAIVEALIMIASRLDLRIVAEGIETEAQARKLQQMGCRLGQGYLFGRPADLNDTETILKARSQRGRP